MWLFVIPFIASAIAFSLPRFTGRGFKILAVLMSFIPLVILVIKNTSLIGTNVTYNWIPALSIQFHLTVDSLSLLFVFLTAIVVPVSILATPSNKLTAPNAFYGLILMVQGLLIGFFTTGDLVVFTLFYEAMLIPIYFLISYWGGPFRRTAALKFIVYMIAGSFLMVAAILFLYFADGAHTFNIATLAKTAQTIPYATWLCAIFILAFAVKTPLFPFHAWLPDAYTQAPTAGTILLSALLSKAGIYGFLRITMELFPKVLAEWSPVLVILGIVGVFYGAFAAWMQNDYKRLIAYSSFSHVNFILIGLFVWNQTAQSGAILQSLNHGITIAALFLVVGWLEDRLGTTAMDPFSGLAKFLPILCWFTLVFVLSSVALPGTNNFVGELMILFGLFIHNPWLSSILCLTVILSVIYMLRWMQKMYFEEPILFQESWVDIKGKEIAIALPLVALILWVGIYPSPVLKQAEKAAFSFSENKQIDSPVNLE